MFSAKALGVCFWQQQSGAAGGQVWGKKKVASRRGFPSGQVGFMKVKSGRQAGGVEDSHPSRASQRQHCSLRKHPPQPHLQRQTQEIFVGTSVWRCFSPSKFDQVNLIKSERNSEKPEEGLPTAVCASALAAACNSTPAFWYRAVSPV